MKLHKCSCLFPVTRWLMILLAVSFPGGFCRAFNGDAYADLAIGVRSESIDTVSFAGQVNVLYSDYSGLTDFGNRSFSQDDPGMDDECEEQDGWGSQLISGDFDGDGFSDLAVGISGEDVGDLSVAGAVQVIYGTPAGLTAENPADQFFTEDTPGIPGEAEPSDYFGSALCAGDFDSDGYDDLVVSAMLEGEANGMAFGAVFVIPGGPVGLDAGGSVMWSQDSDGIEDVGEIRDYFGSALASGDLNGDGFDDLVIGASGEGFEGAESAGCVHVIYGCLDGLTSDGSQYLWQGKPGEVGDVQESYDSFGYALSVADYNADGFEDLAVTSIEETVPGQDIGDYGAGMVQVMYGSASGITDANSAAFFDDPPVDYEQFGTDLTSGDINGDGYTDLVIGVPCVPNGTDTDVGKFWILYGSVSGITTDGSQEYWQGDGIIPDTPERSDLFGSALECGDFNRDGYCDVAAGVQAESFEYPQPIAKAGKVFIMPGSPGGLDGGNSAVWTQNVGTVAGEAESNDEFGYSLAASRSPKRPSACGDTSVTLWMPAAMFTPGGLCRCTASVCNPGLAPIDGYPLFVVLEIVGSYYFAPSFGAYDNYLSMYPQFAPGQTEIEVLPAFTWPSGVGSFSGCTWYGAMTNPEMTSLFGAMDTWTFGWGL